MKKVLVKEGINETFETSLLSPRGSTVILASVKTLKSASSRFASGVVERGTTMEGAGLTRQSSRERVQMPKAVEWNKRRSRAMSSDVEDTIEVIETASAVP